MDLFLPGREPEQEDFEAQSALRTLLESEHIKHCGDEDLYSRISDQIQHNLDMLQRVSNVLGGLVEEESMGEPMFADTSTSGEKTDTRTIDDFLLRVNRVRKEEHLKNVKPLKGAKYV